MAGSPKVVILSEQLRGQSFVLTDEIYTIGRTEDRDICVPDPTISGHHCTLVKTDDGGFLARDEGSTNGTRVNGVRLEENSEQKLVHSDILQVGGIEMLYDLNKAHDEGETSTHTVIDFEKTKTGELPVPEMRNFSPFGSSRSGGTGTKATVMMWIGIAILTLATLGSVAYLVLKMMD